MRLYLYSQPATQSSVHPLAPSVQTNQVTNTSVVQLLWTTQKCEQHISNFSLPDMNLNILAATIRSFKMFIDYIWIWHPLLPLPPIPPSKEREDEEIALKFPLVLAHVIIANTPSKFFHLHLGTKLLSFDWDLLAFSVSNLFLFPPPPFLWCFF